MTEPVGLRRIIGSDVIRDCEVCAAEAQIRAVVEWQRSRWFCNKCWTDLPADKQQQWGPLSVRYV